MKLVDLVRSAAGMRIEDEDGEVDELQLSPALSAAEVEELEERLALRIPPDVRELLAFSRGFENGPFESVCFSGLPGGFAMEEVFPRALPVAHDGFGNYWFVDLSRQSSDWGPILYLCHDPPVVVFQASTLAHFIEELLRFANPPHASEINDVHEEAADRIWRNNPGAIAANELRAAEDVTLRAFAESLPDTFFVVDLRTAVLGEGFSWGRYGPKTRVIRYQQELLFAYEPKSRWQRLIGR